MTVTKMLDTQKTLLLPLSVVSFQLVIRKQIPGENLFQEEHKMYYDVQLMLSERICASRLCAGRDGGGGRVQSCMLT